MKKYFARAFWVDLGHRGLEPLVESRRKYQADRIRKLVTAECPSFVPADPSRDPVATGNRVDTGLWWRQARVWLWEGRDGLLVAATGPRPFCREIPFPAPGRCRYNHVTGHLLLDLERGDPCSALHISPGVAYPLLELIQSRKEITHA